MPHATFTVLSDAGDDAISDDPELVVRAIVATGGAATASALNDGDVVEFRCKQASGGGWDWGIHD